MGIEDENARDTADRIDSEVLLKYLVERGEMFDSQKVKLIGRYAHDPSDGTVKRC